MQEQASKPRRIRARAVDWGGRPSGHCAGCGTHVPHLEFDHIIPYFENGIHDLSNIQWLCHPCHQAKTKEEMHRWRETIGNLHPRTMSEERKRAVGDFFRGRPKSPEHIARASAGIKQAWARKSPEERAAIVEKRAEKHRGKKLGPMSEERKRKIGEAQARSWARKSPEERAAIFAKGAEKNRGTKRGPIPEDRRRKISEAQARAWASGTRKPNRRGSHAAVEAQRALPYFES